MVSRTDQAFDAGGFVQTLAHAPGVYRMLDASGNLLYVGKARDLKKRVSSYFRKTPLGPRIRRMIAQTERMEVTVTATEAEALLLENTLIKQHHPRYNILLRDDKSYPYIYASIHQAYPGLSFYRGRKRRKGRTFGPYASVGALRDTLNILQKLFRTRQCSDSFFRNRSRPCLQYQIKRCTAPCVGYITPEDYRADVDLTLRFLEGRNEEVMRDLTARMDQASERLDYEEAAEWRNRIQSLQEICRHYRTGVASGHFDVIAAVCEGGLHCVQVSSFRGGASHGNRSYFPVVNDAEIKAPELLRGFLGQYYLERVAPPEVLLNHSIPDQEALEEWLSDKSPGQIRLCSRVRGRRRTQVELVERNARQSIATRAQSRSGIRERLDALAEALFLDAMPARLECFDVSHTRGEATVASCVVYTTEGPSRSESRRFNISGITPGDDYGALREALTRRYTRVCAGEYPAPDVLFVDGGKGQFQVAREVLATLDVSNVVVASVAKGEGRKPGTEIVYADTVDGPLHLPQRSVAFHLIQQIRDEAHRFAVTGHRRRRAKRRLGSPLEEIPGVGPQRRQNLLRYFGGWQGVRDATAAELARVPGVGTGLAQEIYDYLHEEST